MNRVDVRSLFSPFTRTQKAARPSAGGLAATAGGARKASKPLLTLESLENRVLLAGDHPSFSQFPTADAVTLNGTGEGNIAGTIEPLGGSITSQDDLFKFVMPTNPNKSGPDFVTLLADTLNSPGSVLNTRLEVYAANLSGQPVKIAESNGNGTLSGGVTPTDAWIGFIANPGTTYYVRVMAEVSTGSTSTGQYKLYIDAMTDVVTINGTTGAGSGTKTLSRAGQDNVHAFTTGSGSNFTSLMALIASGATLDTRVELYNAQGQLLKADSDTGRLQDAYLTQLGAPGTTYYARVRSDKLSGGTSTGSYTLTIDASASAVPLDPVTRRGTLAGSAGGTSTFTLFTFTSQGYGVTIVNAQPAGLPPTDPALSVFDATGTQIDFKDDSVGSSPQSELQIEGGKVFYGVVEGFDVAIVSGVNVFVESNVTYTTGSQTDDHAGWTGAPTPADFAAATPLAYTNATNPKNWMTGSGTQTQHNQVVTAQGQGTIYSNGDRDLFAFVPPVDMLGNYPGKVDPANPLKWKANHRPSARLMLLVQAGAGSFLSAPAVTIYDSKGAVVKSNGGAVFINGGGLPTHLAPFATGFWDPASFDPGMTIPNYGWQPVTGAEGPAVWGGETYYLEISGAVKGTYSFQLILETLPAGSAVTRTDPNWSSSRVRELNESSTLSSGTVPEISVNSATGDTGNTGGISGTFSMPSYYERAYGISGGNADNLPPGFNAFAAGSGTVILEESGYAAIESYADTDLYFFRAPLNGTAEIRINTSDLNDFYNQFISDGEDDPNNPQTNGGTGELQTKTYDSTLDAVIRIFDNDGNQIASNNDNPAITGENGTTFVGNFGNRTFHRRDPRVVFTIESNKQYFVQVESGQRSAYLRHTGQDGFTADPTTPVNWTGLLGSYELMVHTMPDLQGADDHSNTTIFATVLPVVSTLGSPQNGTATLTGVIDDNFVVNPDLDLFTFLSPSRGTATATVSRLNGSSLTAQLAIYDAQLQLINVASADVNGNVSIPFAVLPGERFYVQVDGASGTEGGYQVQVTGLSYADDNDSVWSDLTSQVDLPATITSGNVFNLGTTITQKDYQGFGSTTGNIENAGDTDVFRVTSAAFQQMTIDVVNNSTFTFDPVLTVYEASVDPVGNLVLLRIARDDNGGGGTNSRAVVSMRPTSSRIATVNSVRYPYYYIVVSGANAQTNYGNYTVNVTSTVTDDYTDAGDYAGASVIPVNPDSGVGTKDGVIEAAGDYDANGAPVADTDLFFFTALASGTANVLVDRKAGSTLTPKVSVYVLDPNPTLIASGTAIDLPLGFQPADTGIFNVTRGTVYYVLVERTASTTGSYVVNVVSPPIDDYPNANEWSDAFNIPINQQTGDGNIGNGIIGDPTTPVLEKAGDTDLFQFIPALTGDAIVTVTTYYSAKGNFAPRLEVFDSSQTLIGSIAATQPPTAGNPRTVELTIPGAVGGQVYYVLVSGVEGLPPPATTTGEYLLVVNGNSNPNSGGDPGNIDFNNPVDVTLDTRSGRGSVTDYIDTIGDRDLFYFVAPATGTIYVQVVTPQGSVLDAALTILRAPNELPGSVVASNSAGIPGATADLSFQGVGGDPYWAIVSGVGSNIGAYTLRIQAEPVTHYLYYPEGYTASTVREYVSISNANSFAVTYSVKLRYETGDPESIIVSNAVITAGSRGGVTISDAENGSLAGVRRDTPYSIVIESDGPLGATLSHYDFGGSLGDAFTDTPSSVWNFARVERNPGAVADFLVYYNPNSFDVVATVILYSNDTGPITITQTIGAGRRLGLNINDVGALPVGLHGATVYATPVDSGNISSFVGIVAALSHYATTATAAYGYLGDSEGGVTAGAVPGLHDGDAVKADISFFNPNSAQTVVTITGTYYLATLPPLTRTITVDGGKSVNFTGATLGMAANEAIGLRFTSTLPIIVAAAEAQNGDANATSVSAVAAKGFFFGDAFINTALAGSLYFETLNFYNPTGTTSNVTVSLLFSDSDVLNVNVTVPSHGYNELKLHELAALIQGRPGLNFFSVQATSILPFVASMTHYDLYLGGGWTTNGVVQGLDNLLSTIS